MNSGDDNTLKIMNVQWNITCGQIVLNYQIMRRVSHNNKKKKTNNDEILSAINKTRLKWKALISRFSTYLPTLLEGETIFSVIYGLLCNNLIAAFSISLTTSRSFLWSRTIVWCRKFVQNVLPWMKPVLEGFLLWILSEKIN